MTPDQRESATPGTAVFVRAIARHAKSRPDAVALQTRDEIVSYAALWSLADRVGRLLEEVSPGPVAIAAAKSPRAVAAILACLRAGRPALLPPAGISRRAYDILCARAGAVAEFLVEPDGWCVAEWHGPIAPAGTRADGLLDDACFVLTTSGSTGSPKLVPLPYDGVDRFTRWGSRQFGLRTDSVVLNYAPLNFDLCMLDIWATLARGGRAILVDPDRAVWPRYLRDLMIDTSPTLVQGVPLLFQVLAEAARAAEVSFPSVTHVILTGDHVAPAIRERLPSMFPRARCYNVYGCTETNDSFLHEFRADQAAWLDALPIGQPLPGVRAEIADDGELLVSTPFQARGYLGDDSVGRFVSRSDGMFFRSGDLVRREPSGLVYLIGRNDFQVKVNGIRVNLEQVEQAIAASDGVVEAAAVAKHGAYGPRIHALVRCRRESGLTSLTLRTHCAELLATAMIPAVFKITAEALPRTATGKFDRKQILREFERSSCEHYGDHHCAYQG